MRGNQSRLGSLVEAATNVVVGWVIALLTNLAVLPLFGLPITFSQAAGLGVAFAGVSLVRSYVLRRIFEGFGKQHGRRE